MVGRYAFKELPFKRVPRLHSLAEAFCAVSASEIHSDLFSAQVSWLLLVELPRPQVKQLKCWEISQDEYIGAGVGLDDLA